MLRKSTNSGRRYAVITGVLLIAGLVTGIFSVVPVWSRLPCQGFYK